MKSASTFFLVVVVVVVVVLFHSDFLSEWTNVCPSNPFHVHCVGILRINKCIPVCTFILFYLWTAIIFNFHFINESGCGHIHFESAMSLSKINHLHAFIDSHTAKSNALSK